MARFRNGNLILDANQKLKIDTSEITTDNSKLDINKPIKVQSLELQSGPAITNITNSSSSDSTSEIMTSKAVQEYIEDTLSNYSVGTDAVGSITKINPDIESSQLFYGANNVEIDPDIMNWGIETTELTIGSTEYWTRTFLLSSGLICVLKTVKVGSYYHLNISYYDNVNLKYSTTLFESLNLTSSPYSLGLNNSVLSNGGFVFVARQIYSTSNNHLVAVNADCSSVIIKEIPNTIQKDNVILSILPNDDIVYIQSVDVNESYMGVFRADFDTTSFTTIEDFTTITGSEFVGNYIIPQIEAKYIGNNRIACLVSTSGASPRRHGIGLLDISQKEIVKVTTEVTISGSASALLIGPDKKIYLPIDRFNEKDIQIRIFDENIERIDIKTYSGVNYFQGLILPMILDNGNILCFYIQGELFVTDPNLAYIMVDKNGNLIYNNKSMFGDMPLNLSMGGGFLKDDGNVILITKMQTGDPITFYNFNPILTTNALTLGDTSITSISNDPYSTEDDVLLTTAAIDNKIYNKNVNLNNLSKPYISGDRNLGLDLLDKYNAFLYSRNFMTGATSASATITDEGYLALIYTTSSLAKADLINPLTAEHVNSVTLSIPSASAMSASKREALRSENGCIVSYINRLLSGDGYVVAIDQNGNQTIDPYYVTGSINSMVVLPNNEILVSRYYSSKTQINRLRVDVDSTSFLSITGWQDTELPQITNTFDIGNSRYLHTTSTIGLVTSDIDGNIIKQLAFSSAGVLSAGEVFYNKVTNLIYAIGYYSTATNSRILTYNTDLELLDLYDLGGLTYNSSSERSAAVLPNGDFVFGFNITSVGTRLVIIKPNGKIIINGVYSATSFEQKIYLGLPDGQTIMSVGTSNDINVIFYYKELKDEPGKYQKLYKDYASLGYYDFKIPKFQKKTINSSITRYSSTPISIIPFSSGRCALIYTKNVSPYRPVMNIYNQNDELIVDTQDIFLGDNMSGTGVVSLSSDSYETCTGFIDRNWLVASFRNETSGQGCVVIYDDEGDQVCDPIEVTSGTNLVVGALEGGKLYMVEYSVNYNQGTGTHPQVWEINSDTSSRIIIQAPLRIGTYIDIVSKYSFLSKNRVAGISTSSSGMSVWNTRSFGRGFQTGSFGYTMTARPAATFPDNRVMSLFQVGASAPYSIKSYTWQYNQTNDKINNIGLNDEIFTSLSTFSGRSIARSNSGAAVVGVFNEYPLPSKSLYRYGIKLLNSLGEIINTDDLLNEQSTSAYSKILTVAGFDGQIYTVLSRSSSTIIFDKWIPVIRKDSPLKYGYDVRIVATSVGITLDKNYLDQRVTYNDTVAVNVTVPSNTSDPLPIGFRCSFSRLNTGAVTFVAGSGVTIVSAGSYLSLGATGSLAEITKIDTNTWLLTGDLA